MIKETFQNTGKRTDLSVKWWWENCTYGKNKINSIKIKDPIVKKIKIQKNKMEIKRKTSFYGVRNP